MNNKHDLKRVIEKSHGAICIHIASVPVTETLDDSKIWDGIVEVYMLNGHAEAKTAYAWSYKTDDPDDPIRHETVLHLPPVDSPQTAVRSAITKNNHAPNSA
jgi:hypothetical protein